jgi:hypothetical protein
MDKGNRIYSSDVGAESPLNPASPLRMVLLYDQPAVYERARQMFATLSRTMNAGRPIQIEAWRFDTLHEEWHADRLRKAIITAEMLVVAADAAANLPEAAELEIRLWLELSKSNARALLAFLEGASPEARRYGFLFDRLQELANFHGADCYMHISAPVADQRLSEITGGEPNESSLE